MTAREIADDLIVDAGLIEITREEALWLRVAISQWLRTVWVAFTGESMEIGLL